MSFKNSVLLLVSLSTSILATLLQNFTEFFLQHFCGSTCMKALSSYLIGSDSISMEMLIMAVYFVGLDFKIKNYKDLLIFKGKDPIGLLSSDC